MLRHNNTEREDGCINGSPTGTIKVAGLERKIRRVRLHFSVLRSIGDELVLVF